MGLSRTIPLDGGAGHLLVALQVAEIKLISGDRVRSVWRSSQALSNLQEEDHRDMTDAPGQARRNVVLIVLILYRAVDRMPRCSTR